MSTNTHMSKRERHKARQAKNMRFIKFILIGGELRE